MSLARWRDIFIILGIGLAIFVTLYGDVRNTGRSAGDVFCEYLRENEPEIYSNMMGNPKYLDATRTCCAYDPNHSACSTIK